MTSLLLLGIFFDLSVTVSYLMVKEDNYYVE